MGVFLPLSSFLFSPPLPPSLPLDLPPPSSFPYGVPAKIRITPLKSKPFLDSNSSYNDSKSCFCNIPLLLMEVMQTELNSAMSLWSGNLNTPEAQLFSNLCYLAVVHFLSHSPFLSLSLLLISFHSQKNETMAKIEKDAYLLFVRSIG